MLEEGRKLRELQKKNEAKLAKVLEAIAKYSEDEDSDSKYFVYALNFRG